MSEIILKEWDYDKKETVETAKVNIRSVARNINSKQFAELIEDYCNVISYDFDNGVAIGEELRTTHRTLQRTAVIFALGILEGISRQERTDPRNETAIETAKKISEMLKKDELPVGPFI